MCKLKSGLLFKDRVFLPDYDSHDKMLDELGIEDNYIGASNTFVRFEVCPDENGSVFTDPKDWIYKVDQDILPDWYDEIDGENRAREAVKKWFYEHVHIGSKIFKISSGIHYVKDCNINFISGNANVVTVCGNSNVEFVYDNAFIKCAVDNVTIKSVYDNAVLKYVYDNTTVNLVDGNATVNDVYGNAKLKLVCGKATVNSVHGNATVNEVCGNATIKSVYGNSTINSVFENATVKSVSGYAIVVNGKKIIVASDSNYVLQKGV